MKTSISDLLPEEIAAAFDLKKFQGKQIYQWIHKKGVFDFELMTNLSKALRARLEAEAQLTHVDLVELQTSEISGTKKVLLRYADGEAVESVLIRDGERMTVCLSSQVGCPLRCAFCATGLVGFKRQLSAGEIVEQILFLLQDADLGDRTPNVVYMGMGEPFNNYDAVLKSIRMLMHPDGLGIGARKITVSTVGDVPGIERFSEEDWQVRLSISLHAANNALRNRLAPINKKYPLERLREAILTYQQRTGRQVTFEWTLLDEVNDSEQDVRELLGYMKGLRASVNLIPWNPVQGLPYRPATKQRAQSFVGLLKEAGIQATMRQEKGQDIDAACGQLRRIKAEA